MENKDRFHNAFKENDGRLNETELGYILGLNEEETAEIIAQLLSENKIEYTEHNASNYNIKRKMKKKYL